MRHVEGRPQVVAHRGSSHDNPEHTLGAYVAALDEGAEGLECDVRLTADGHLVCVHDRRVDRVSNGRGVVSTMELAQLDELDFASWKNPWVDLDDEAPEIDEQTRRVLTLRAAAARRSRDYDQPVDLAIETKHPTRYAGLVERRLVDLLDDVRLGGRRLAGPGDELLAGRAHPGQEARARPGGGAADRPAVLLADGRRACWAPGWIAGPGIDLLRENPRLGRRLRKRDRRIHVWTVNTTADLDLCAGRGRGGRDHRQPAAWRSTTSTGPPPPSSRAETHATARRVFGAGVTGHASASTDRRPRRE